MLVVFDTCRDFIRTVPVLQHDPDKAEDLDTSAEDHAADDVSPERGAQDDDADADADRNKESKPQ